MIIHDIAAAARGHGWTLKPLGDNPVYGITKDYATAAGGNTAVFICRPDLNYLQGSYRSAGEDALATMDRFTLERLGPAEFFRESERRIDRTYGRRLLGITA